MSTRGSYCVSAPRSSSTPENVSRNKAKRKRSKRGGRKKKKGQEPERTSSSLTELPKQGFVCYIGTAQVFM